MKRRRPSWLDRSGFNPFRMMEPSIQLRERAAEAGINPNDKAAVDAWAAEQRKPKRRT